METLRHLVDLHTNPHTEFPTENLSALMDFYLQPLVEKTTSYTRDSVHPVNILEKTSFPPNTLLVTIDVQALYPSIPQAEGIDAAVDALYNHNPEVEEVPFPPSVAKEILAIILKRNIFEFNGRMYRQLRGTAMGTKDEEGEMEDPPILRY